MIVKGNDRILFIKRGENFLPIGCLTSNGMSEDMELIPTSTRNSQGWRTFAPSTQGFSVSFSGFQVATAFRDDNDFAVNTNITVTFNLNVECTFRMRIIGTGSFFWFFNKIITSNSTLVADNPFLYIQLGSSVSETVQNIANNLNTYNPNSVVNVTNSGTNLVITFGVEGEFTVTNFAAFDSIGTPNIATQTTTYTEVANPSPLVSYDRLRQIKRNREFCTFRIQDAGAISRYIDEFEGYITAIDDISDVNQDATFSGSITGWGVPRFIISEIGLATNDEFIEDGNDNIIEP